MLLKIILSHKLNYVKYVVPQIRLFFEGYEAHAYACVGVGVFFARDFFDKEVGVLGEKYGGRFIFVDYGKVKSVSVG